MYYVPCLARYFEGAILQAAPTIYVRSRVLHPVLDYHLPLLKGPLAAAAEGTIARNYIPD